MKPRKRKSSPTARAASDINLRDRFAAIAAERILDRDPNIEPGQLALRVWEYVGALMRWSRLTPGATPKKA